MRLERSLRMASATLAIVAFFFSVYLPLHKPAAAVAVPGRPKAKGKSVAGNAKGPKASTAAISEASKLWPGSDSLEIPPELNTTFWILEKDEDRMCYNATFAIFKMFSLEVPDKTCHVRDRGIV
ncbi:hypothetical protein BCR37DRAFT_407905 [Protomyces lactucae-debilis]|uniref:Uncharacterized protein n=1 Tax=Protomyces lactucae-debilis TaxID=2754530 RepID=A0A1Y2FLZ9_PROLT|nr:uncharacterized protein BCR37DRAFT_407905 [Protomyces lactucae-debilis]ORY84978.1 hypothetical protein BCR37DRAFT_407905 [Protomyces lactucae-debilis]